MLKRVILVQCKTPGDVLRKLRTDRGLTQKAVAEALNITRSTYSFHESGKTQPDFQRVTALAAIFEVPLGQMVEMLSNPEKTEQAASKKRVPKKSVGGASRDRPAPSGGKVLDCHILPLRSRKPAGDLSGGEREAALLDRAVYVRDIRAFYRLRERGM